MPQLAAVGIRVVIGKTSDRSHHAVIAIEKSGPGGDDGLQTTQVAPPLSSETLRSSKVAQSQEESSSCGSEHRRISEDTGGGIEIDLEKKRSEVCAQCGKAGDLQQTHYGAEEALLHRDCRHAWVAARDDLTIPACLDRRHEVTS
jgi:hypothetical protein